MMAAWNPLWTPTSNAATATTVLPEPTSPWSSRCMGAGAAMSAPISSITRRWAPVGLNGRPSMKRSTRSGSGWIRCAMPTDSLSLRFLVIASATSWRKNSSNTSRRRAAPTSARESGK